MFQDLVEIYKILKEFHTICHYILVNASTLTYEHLCNLTNEYCMYDHVKRHTMYNFKYHKLNARLDYLKNYLIVTYGISIESSAYKGSLYETFYDLIKSLVIARKIINEYKLTKRLDNINIRKVYVACCYDILKLYDSKGIYNNCTLTELCDYTKKYIYNVLPYVCYTIVQLYNIIMYTKEK